MDVFCLSCSLGFTGIVAGSSLPSDIRMLATLFFSVVATIICMTKRK